MAITRLSSSQVGQGLPKFQTAWDSDNVAQGAIEPIASVVLTANTSSVAFSNIPQTYQYLHLSISARTTYTNYSESLSMRANGSTTAIYGAAALVTADTTYPGNQLNNTNWTFAQVVGASAPAGLFSTTEVYFMNYSDTVKYKNAIARTAADYNLSTSGAMGWYALRYGSASAITSLTIESANGVSIVAGSTFTLYGIKGGF